MVDYSFFQSSEYSITGGSGNIQLVIPLNVVIAAIGFRFKGVSITGSYPAQGTWYSGVEEVVNGGSSSGGYPSGATSAACAYIGRSLYQAAPPTQQNTGWADSGQSGSGNNVSNSITVPTIPGGGEFQSGTVEYYGYNYDGQTRSLYINGSGPYSVGGSGNYKMISAALSAGDMGKTKNVNVYGSGKFNRARVRAIIYYLGSGYLIETKTGSCSNNYGGSVVGPLNNGQTGSSSMRLPSGNISHSIGGSGQAGFQYQVQYTYQQAYEIKTSNVQASCGGFSCGYSEAINNGSWVLPYSGNDAWIWMDPLAFQPGNTATINISVGGSKKCGVKVAYAYTRARPTVLNTYEARKYPNTTIQLPIVDKEDINLDLNSYVRILVPTSPTNETPIERAMDMVEVDDGDAGPVRIRAHVGTKAFRKKIA